MGTDHDTSAFAVQTLRRWRDTVGCRRYPHADRLLICADGGGSNGYRIRAWKTQLAAETGLAITVCHLPAGSKWTKIEPAVLPNHHDLARPASRDPPDEC